MVLGIPGVDGLSPLLGHRGALSLLLVALPAPLLLDLAGRGIVDRWGRRLHVIAHRAPVSLSARRPGRRATSPFC
jgi:hypothetical protein